MEKLSSLLDYYYESMYVDLKVLETKRLGIIAKLKNTVLVLLALGLILFFSLIQTTLILPLHAFMVTAIVGLLIYAFIYHHETSGYKLFFKDQIIEKIIHFIDPSLMYFKYNSITKEEYHRAGIFSQEYDRFNGNDLVTGTIDGVDVRFSDLHVEKKEHDKEKTEHWHTIFQGLFFVADFNKNFHSKTFVLPDFAQRSFGVLGEWMQGMNRSKGELIMLDDNEFEKYFVVYGDNQIESRYILTHSLMKRIVEFKIKNKKNISMSFVDSKMYLCIDYKKELFEPILSKSLLEFSHIREYFELLSMIIGIVDEFKLNEKIWSKR